jgi:hypothetical protein
MKEFDIIKKYLPRVLCAAMSLTIVCSSVGVTAYSAGVSSTAQTAGTAKKAETKATEKKEDPKKFSKEETVYVIAGADGTPKKVIVSGWIKNNKKEKTITDKSNLKDLENVKGDETYTIDEQKMVQWDADGKDIFYKGNSDEQLPVGVTIKYELDGKAVDPSQLAGKSGKLKMTFNYTNRQFKEVKVNGKNEKIYVPFIMMTGMMLAGSSRPSELPKSRFGTSEKSRRMRSPSFFSSRAGLRSTAKVYFPLTISCICADAESTRGPLMPKCVNSISPCCAKIFLPVLLSVTVSPQFFSDSPIARAHSP